MARENIIGDSEEKDLRSLASPVSVKEGGSSCVSPSATGSASEPFVFITSVESVFVASLCAGEDFSTTISSLAAAFVLSLSCSYLCGQEE